ncbi:MAG TPA: LacI family DNA-binding transcriptional regulator, partial [Kiritimatiellia bacterium]
MRTTIKDVAERVGVNAGTVSKALNGRPGVRPDLRRRILDKAAELDYSPSGAARSLVIRRTETIGIVYDLDTGNLFANPFWGYVLAGVEDELREQGYAAIFSSLAASPSSTEAHVPKFITEHRVDGVLVFRQADDAFLQDLEDRGRPFVLVDYNLPNRTFDAITTDNRRGAYMATEHLLKLGHKQIAFIGGPHRNFMERHDGYEAALADHGVRYRDALVHLAPVDDGYMKTFDLLERAPDLTAIVACNDANALSAMRALRSRNIEVPDQVSVVGFDDIVAAEEATPALTTMQVDKRAMGAMAARRLLSRIRGDDPSPQHQTEFPARLVVRKT